MNELHELVELAKSRPAHSRESVLDSDTRELLDAFVEALVADGKTTATARSYRSYLVTALTSGKTWSELSSDCRSAVRAYARLMA
jgi:hypothetical protein